jgi:hypothetical protein
VWEFKSGGGWFHPVHIHLVEFIILARDSNFGLRPYEYQSTKDVVYLGPGGSVYVMTRFGPHKGDYMFHCHNLMHEDNEMMRAFTVTNSTLGPNKESAVKFNINPLNSIIYDNYEYSDPTMPSLSPKPTSTVTPLTNQYMSFLLSKNFYAIFYPTPKDIALMQGIPDLWQEQWCPLPNSVLRLNSIKDSVTASSNTNSTELPL